MLDEQEKDRLRQLLTLAETVRPKLLGMLTLGPRSVEHEAYAIKARVKSFDSAVDKIMEKRAGKPEEDKAGNPNYGPLSLTDVIGVRILCLWPDDISRVLERLITTVREIIGTGLSSFRDADISKVITEVIVYKGPNSPAIYDVIGDQLSQWFESDPVELRECVRVEPSPKQRPYSSIHLVVWCRAPMAGAWESIPVEIQVRTSLEDVWSEAEHRLRYKAKSLPEGQNAEIGFRMLEDLKGQLDIAASTITSARDLLTVTPSPGGAAARIAAPADPVAEFGLSKAPGALGEIVAAVARRLDACYREFEANRVDVSAEWRQRFAELALAIGNAIDVVEGAGPEVFVDNAAADRWRFWSRMEQAQANYWQARLAGQSARRGADDATPREADALAETCLKQYLELMADEAFRSSSILWFRFGYALLDLKGDFPQALVYLQRAYELLNCDDELPEGSPYRLTIPRMYAYAMWRVQNQQFQESVSRYGIRSPVAAMALEQIQTALNITKPLVRGLDKVVVEGGLWDEAVERRRIHNNLLSFVWDYAVRAEQAAGTEFPEHAALISQAKKAVGAGALQTAYKGLASAVAPTDNSIPVSTLHTLVAGALLTGNKKAFDAALERLKVELSRLEAEGSLSTDEEQIRGDLALFERSGR